MGEKLTVQYAQRAPGALRSIEELFATIAAALPERIIARVSEASAGRVRPRAIWANLRWAGRLREGDLVHQTGDIHYAVLAVRKLPVVLTIHDLRFFEEATGLKRFLFRWFWLELPCRKASRVTVISEFTRQRLMAHCQVESSKVRVIPNCVAPEFEPVECSWPQSSPRMLVVGTTPNKNLERVVAACEGLDLSLSILGGPSDTQAKLLERTGLTFESHSGLSRAEVVGLYQSCDLVCFVSTYEGFGMPILEGQATGRPVLSSNIPPMNEVAGDGALLVDPHDEKAIREGLLRLLGEPELRGELVRKGFENVARYSATAIAAQYADLYREVQEEA